MLAWLGDFLLASCSVWVNCRVPVVSTLQYKKKLVRISGLILPQYEDCAFRLSCLFVCLFFCLSVRDRLRITIYPGNTFCVGHGGQAQNPCLSRSTFCVGHGGYEASGLAKVIRPGQGLF